MLNNPIIPHVKKLLKENPAISIFLDAINEFGTIIEPENLFRQILNVCLKTFKAEGGSVMLFNRGKEELEIKSAEGLKSEIIEKAKIKYGEGIAGWVAKELEPLLIIGDNTDPRFTSMKEKSRTIKDSIVAPIIIGSRVLGVISLNNRIDGVFTDRDKELLTVVATVAAMVIERMEFSNTQKQQLIEVDLTNAISKAIGGSLDEKEIYRTMLELFRRHMDFALFAILFIEDKNIKIVPVEPVTDTLIAEVKTHLCELTYTLNKQALNPDDLTISFEGGLSPLILKEPSHVGSFLDMPLNSRGRNYGILFIASTRADAFKEADVHFFSIVAEQASTAIDNARFYSILENKYKEVNEKLRQCLSGTEK